MNRPDDLDRAEARAAEARARLDATVEQIQVRLDPTTLKRLAFDTVSQGGNRALAASSTAARGNPLLLVGAMAVIAGWLARKRLRRAVSRKAPPPQQPLLLERVAVPKPDPARRITENDAVTN